MQEQTLDAITVHLRLSKPLHLTRNRSAAGGGRDAPAVSLASVLFCSVSNPFYAGETQPSSSRHNHHTPSNGLLQTGRLKKVIAVEGRVVASSRRFWMIQRVGSLLAPLLTCHPTKVCVGASNRFDSFHHYSPCIFVEKGRLTQESRSTSSSV